MEIDHIKVIAAHHIKFKLPIIHKSTNPKPKEANSTSRYHITLLRHPIPSLSYHNLPPSPPRSRRRSPPISPPHPPRPCRLLSRTPSNSSLQLQQRARDAIADGRLALMVCHGLCSGVVGTVSASCGGCGCGPRPGEPR